MSIASITGYKCLPSRLTVFVASPVAMTFSLQPYPNENKRQILLIFYYRVNSKTSLSPIQAEDKFDMVWWKNKISVEAQQSGFQLLLSGKFITLFDNTDFHETNYSIFFISSTNSLSLNNHIIRNSHTKRGKIGTRGDNRDRHNTVRHDV